MTEDENNELIQNLKKDIQEWENQEIEFKEKFPKNRHKLAKEIAAFSTSNSGRIYLGVGEDKEIKGVDDFKHGDFQEVKDNFCNRISIITQNVIKPSVIVNNDFIRIDEKRVVVKINVPKGIEPIYFTSNTPYIRNNTIATPASPNQVKELHRKYFKTYNISMDEVIIYLEEDVYNILNPDEGTSRPIKLNNRKVERIKKVEEMIKVCKDFLEDSDGRI